MLHHCLSLISIIVILAQPAWGRAPSGPVRKQAGPVQQTYSETYPVLAAKPLPDLTRELIALWWVTLAAAGLWWQRRKRRQPILVKVTEPRVGPIASPPPPNPPPVVATVEPGPPLLSADERFLQTVDKIVEEHLQDPGFGILALAVEIGLSERHFRRKFKALTKTAPSCYLREKRLTYAMSLLKSRVGTVSEVAYRVGFNDARYFSTVFQKRFGIAPSAVLRA